MNPRYKLTILKKEIDFQSLVGYIGGYIGIFLGFALAQIPDTIAGAITVGKSVYTHLYQENPTHAVPIQQIQESRSN